MSAPREKEIFLDAVERPTAERAGFVERACAGDAELGRRVRALLDAHAIAEEALAEAPDAGERTWPRPAAGERARAVPATATLPGELAPGDRVGPYRLVAEIGAGGFGTVWRAVQEAPVRRTAALKVVKAGMDSREVLARFEVERQALALMDHPSIARVFESGATGTGRPYFAMELVDGLPITTWCATRELGTRARIELLLQVCRAVQHAHQKGVIHRDLKPSNVLVTEVDGRAVPKVIDFGIAKATAQRLTPETFETRVGHLVGTPAYMSPEQVTGAADVDTRSDVYSLGVLLYEVLVGAPPFDADTWRTGDLAEIRRVIREVEPPRPSTRVGQRTELGLRRTLSRRFRGDLDWIVMRCLEKERDRRYGSAGTLADELERHLRGEPVLAGPPSLRYRAAKFARRHRGALLTVAGMVLLLVAGTVVSTAQAVRATRAEQRASEAAARTSAELAKAEAVLEFLREVLWGVDPAIARGKDRALLRHLLEEASARVDAAAQGLPEVAATLRHVIGRSYFALALYDEAEPHLAAALALREDALGPDDPATLEALNDLAGLYLFSERDAEAEPLLERAVAGRRRVLGPEDPATLSSLGNLGNLRRRQGRLDEAAAILFEVEGVRVRTLGPEDPATIVVTGNLAEILQELGRVDEAEERLVRALEVQRRTIGDENPRTLIAFNNLGTFYSDLGRYADALPLLERALEVKQSVLEPDHPSVVIAMNNLAALQRKLGAVGEAERLYRDGLERMRAGSRTAPVMVAQVEMNLGNLLRKEGRLAEAEPLLGAARDALAAHLRPADPRVLVADDSVAAVLIELGRLAEARVIVERGLELAETSLPPQHPGRGVHRLRLGLLLAAEGRPAEALAELERAHALLAEHPRQEDELRATREALAEVCTALDRDADAARWRALLD